MISWRTRRKITLQMIPAPLIMMGIKEGAQLIYELRERREVFAQARAYADSVGKPLLVVGAPKRAYKNHPCGDVTIDNSPDVLASCPYEIADVRNIPYPDKYFGTSFCSHVLEHLATIGDARRALAEMERVSDKVFVVSPHKESLAAWLHPEHHLWLDENDKEFIIEQRVNRLRERSKI